MRYLDLTLSEPARNLALDEALLLEVEAGADDILRVWEFPALVVVLGSGCRLADDVPRGQLPVGRYPDPPSLQRRRQRPMGIGLSALHPRPAL